MSKQGRDWASAQTTGDFTLKAVLDKLGHLADPRGLVYHGQSTIAAMMECDRKTITRALKKLEELKLIRREQRVRRDGSRSTDHIFLKRTPEAEDLTVPEEGQRVLTGGLESPRVGTDSREGGGAKSHLTTFESDSESDSESVSDPVGSAPGTGAAVRDFRKELFERGVRTLRERTGRPELRCRSVIAGWLKLADDDAAVVLRAIEAAAEAEAIEPVAWIEARLKRPATAGPSGTAVAPSVAAERQAEALRMAARGEWPIGGTVYVEADSPGGRAWEAHFRSFGRAARWRQCPPGWGGYLPAAAPPPIGAVAAA